MKNIFVISALFITSGLYAQTPGPPPPRPMGLGMMGLGRGPGSHKIVTNAPYSADVSSSSVQTLSDGNTITHTTVGHVARDAQGRTYLQETRAEDPLNSSDGKSVITFISDPIAGYTYMLNSESKVAVRRVFKVPSSESTAEANSRHAARQSANSSERVESELGQQSVNGVITQGKSVTRTVPAGAIGNAQPLVEKSEVWISPDLQVVVLSKRSDPRIGQTTYSLTNIQRAEPKAALFQVPSDYTVQDAQSWRRPE